MKPAAAMKKAEKVERTFVAPRDRKAFEANEKKEHKAEKAEEKAEKPKKRK